jgi:hypothetical protein
MSSPVYASVRVGEGVDEIHHIRRTKTLAVITRGRAAEAIGKGLAPAEISEP